MSNCQALQKNNHLEDALESLGQAKKNLKKREKALSMECIKQGL